MQKKILVIDDEPDIVLVVEGRLRANGYDVITAKDGEEGLEKAKIENPDLILLDVMMPKIDGYKVCGLLKMDARYKDIPIIILTARVSSAEQKTVEDVGADAYIPKPFDSEAVLAKIKELIGQ